MRWNAPTALECAGKHRLRRIAPIALEFCLQPGTQPILPSGCRSLVATAVFQPAVSGSACRAKFLWLTAGSSSRSPAISLRLSVREIKNSGQKLNVLLF